MKFTHKLSPIIVLLVLFLGLKTGYSQNEQEKIDSLLIHKRAFNKTHAFIFKIQLYNGNETEAYKTKARFETIFSEYKVSVIYSLPEFKTQIGPFKTRLEADRVLNIIRKKFVTARVLKDKN